MRVPRVQFRVRRLMALVAGVAFMMPIGMWVRDMWWRRVYLLDGAGIVAINERTARKFISLPNVTPYWYEYWSAYADKCARVRRHRERAAATPWRDPGPDPQ